MPDLTCIELIPLIDLLCLAMVCKLIKIAPVIAVKGNVDRGELAEKLPLTDVVNANGQWLYLIHILDDLSLDPKAAGMSMVIHGHLHKPEIVTRDDVIYLNPGSAGPKRGNDPVSLAIIQINDQELIPEIIILEH